MIVQLIKLIWNRKHRNVLLTLEIILSFMVLFSLFSLLIVNWNRYHLPLGFDYHNVWSVDLNWKGTPSPEVKRILKQAIETLQVQPGVVAISYGQPGLYDSSRSTSDFKDLDHILNLNVDQNFQEVFRTPLLEGQWFQDADARQGYKPIVINRELRELAFGEGPAVGQVIEAAGRESIVTGVIDYFRYHEFAKSEPIFFEWIAADPEQTYEFNVLRDFLFIRVEATASRQLEEKIMQTLWNAAPEWTFNLTPLEEIRDHELNLKVAPLFIIGAVGVFLLINVALGIFGVLWYNMSRRHQEVGLRRALGGSVAQMFQFFLGEVLILTTLGIVCGLFFTIQVPLLGMFPVVDSRTFLQANLLAAISIYGLIVVCALYPSHLASKIEPALALKSE